MSGSTDMLENLVMLWGHASWLGKLGFIISVPILLVAIVGWSLTWGVCHHDKRLKQYQ